MKSKYFTVEIKPTIANVAVGQHAAFANGDILFDWFAFDVPRGSAKLLGATVEIRPKGDSGATPNKFALELMLAKPVKQAAPFTLGAVNSAPTAILNANRMIGYVPVVAGDFADELDSISFAQVSPPINIVLEADSATGTHVGFDTYYIAGIAADAIDFTSLTRINAGTLDGSSFTVNGTDPRLFMVVGDTIAATTTADTDVSKELGVIKSMTDVNITIESTTKNAIVNDDFIYNTTPLKVVLHFEK